VESGAEVWGLRRDALALKALEAVGIKSVQADLTKPESLVNLPQVDFVVLCQAPLKPGDNYHSTYFEATENLIESFHLRKPKKLIMISSTSVYGTMGGAWVNEETNPEDAGYLSKEAEAQAKTLLKTEKFVLSSLIPSIIFRLGGIYGPKRNRLQAIKEGKLAPALSDLYSNRIQVDDAVSGIRLLLEKGKLGEIYLGVDDEPSTGDDFYSWIYEELSIKKTQDSGKTAENDRVSNKRCSNKKMKALGWTLKYPTYKEGYKTLMNEAGH
jgi:nucleoside-diphosphate-sugar epimerase